MSYHTPRSRGFSWPTLMQFSLRLADGCWSIVCFPGVRNLTSRERLASPGSASLGGFRGSLPRGRLRPITTVAVGPWQNGKVERFGRTMQEGWAYRQIFTSSSEGDDDLSPWLDFYNDVRPHNACGGNPPISRVPPTS